MYVCICNAINDKKMAAAVDGTTRHVGDVFRRCGHRPKCGKCLPDVADLIEEQRSKTEPQKIAAE